MAKSTLEDKSIANRAASAAAQSSSAAAAGAAASVTATAIQQPSQQQQHQQHPQQTGIVTSAGRQNRRPKRSAAPTAHVAFAQAQLEAIAPAERPLQQLRLLRPTAGGTNDGSGGGDAGSHDGDFGGGGSDGIDAGSSSTITSTTDVAMSAWPLPGAVGLDVDAVSKSGRIDRVFDGQTGDGDVGDGSSVGVGSIIDSSVVVAMADGNANADGADDAGFVSAEISTESTASESISTNQFPNDSRVDNDAELETNSISSVVVDVNDRTTSTATESIDEMPQMDAPASDADNDGIDVAIVPLEASGAGPSGEQQPLDLPNIRMLNAAEATAAQAVPYVIHNESHGGANQPQHVRYATHSTAIDADAAADANNSAERSANNTAETLVGTSDTNNMQRILVNVSIATDSGSGTQHHAVYMLHVSVPAGPHFPAQAPQQYRMYGNDSSAKENVRAHSSPSSQHQQHHQHQTSSHVNDPANDNDNDDGSLAAMCRPPELPPQPPCPCDCTTAVSVDDLAGIDGFDVGTAETAATSPAMEVGLETTTEDVRLDDDTSTIGPLKDVDVDDDLAMKCMRTQEVPMILILEGQFDASRFISPLPISSS